MDLIGNFPSQKKPEFSFYIDIVSKCNLSCPSCANGNTVKKNPTPTIFMKPAFLHSILKKAKSECNIKEIGLYNWNEPLLHPFLPEMVKMIKDINIPCLISSNLNIADGLYEVMILEPYAFFVSVSGFEQSIYSVTHKGGDITKVKKNMAYLAELKKKKRLNTKLFVSFHKYIDNSDDELEMKKFSEALGFEFQTFWAHMMPLEKYLKFLNVDLSDVVLSDDDLKIIKKLALPLESASKAAFKLRNLPCTLKNKQIILNCVGDVKQCCITFDNEKYVVGNYLKLSIDEIQQKRANRNICGECTKKGGHIYYTYSSPDFDKIALQQRNKYLKQE